MDIAIVAALLLVFPVACIAGEVVIDQAPLTHTLVGKWLAAAHGAA